MEKLAQSNPFGAVPQPQGLSQFGNEPGVAIGRLIQFGLRTLIVVACVYAVFNLVLAGYSFMSAGDDSKKVAGAWAQIWQTMLGVSVAAGSFVLAGIFGQLIFGDWNFLLRPTIPNL